MIRRYYGRRRRWHFNASANLPIIGKTSVSFGNKKRQMLRRKRSVMYKIAKNVVRNTASPKTFVNTKVDLNPTAHTMYTYNVLDQITKGTDDENRIGEHIHLKNFLLNIQTISAQIGEASDLGLEKYMRIITLTDNAEHTGSGYPGTGFGYSDIFENNDVKLNIVSPTLHENITVLKDQTFKISTGDMNKKSETKCIKYNVPLNRNFIYKDGSTYGKSWNLYVVILVSVPGLASGTAISTSYSWGSHVNFSDTK